MEDLREKKNEGCPRKKKLGVFFFQEQEAFHDFHHHDGWNVQNVFFLVEACDETGVLMQSDLK